MKKWKSLIAAAAVTLFAGAVLAGCDGGSGAISDIGGVSGSSDSDPAAPKEVVTKFKLGDKDVPLYEYKGVELPKLQGFHSNLAVTKDAIYALSFEQTDQKYHLKKMVLKDGAITGIEDLGKVEKEPITSDGTNVYYILDHKGKVGCYDGTAATSFDVKGTRTIRAVYGDKNAYTSGDFVSQTDTMFGAISKEGMKDAKVILPKDAFKKLSHTGDAKEENNAFLMGADKDGFYITTLATHGGASDQWTFPLHMYGSDGKQLRTFACNENLPSGAQMRKAGERQVCVTKDYVVFYDSGYIRVFHKKDGKYVGDIELKKDGGKKYEPKGMTANDANHIYFIDDDTHIYRIDL